jgi:hypothetical protein
MIAGSAVSGSSSHDFVGSPMPRRRRVEHAVRRVESLEHERQHHDRHDARDEEAHAEERATAERRLYGQREQQRERLS